MYIIARLKDGSIEDETEGKLRFPSCRTRRV